MKSALLLTALLLLWAPLSAADADIESLFVQALKEEILTKDSATAMQRLEKLRRSLEELKQRPSPAALEQSQQDFTSFAGAWKGVEAVYIAGYLDEEYLDHPRFIDYYHQAKESIPEQVEKALDSGQPLQQALFKYSTRSIDALEYLLFAPPARGTLLQEMQKREGRRIDAALLALDNIASWLGEIAHFYRTTDRLTGNPSHTISSVVNALIDSSYKLANWRVGEAAGLTRKYAGRPSASRLEYSLAGASWLAIDAILKTHRRVIDRPGEQDLLAVARARGALSVLEFVRSRIDAAQETLDRIPPPLSRQVGTPAFAQLFRQLDELHKAYYFMLIDALGLDARIIDADGD